MDGLTGFFGLAIVVSVVGAWLRWKSLEAEQREWESGDQESNADPDGEEWHPYAPIITDEDDESHKAAPISQVRSSQWPSASRGPQLLSEWEYSRRARLDWSPYAKCSPFKGRGILGVSALAQILLPLAAGAAFASVLFAYEVRIQRNRGWLIVGGLLLSAMWFIMSRAADIARRHFTRLEFDSMLRAPEKPVLFLRGFETDSESLARTSHGVSVPDPNRWVSWRAEEAIAASVRISRPFIGLGSPGEDLPTSGAGRFYLADPEDWQEAVKELSDIAALNIIRMSDSSDAVLWEAEHCLRNHPMKTALLTVERDGEPFTKQRYMDLRLALLDRYPTPLPLEGWRCWYFVLNEENEWEAISASYFGRELSGLRDATDSLLALKLAVEPPGLRIDRFRTWDFLPLKYAAVATIAIFLAYFSY